MHVDFLCVLRVFSRPRVHPHLERTFFPPRRFCTVAGLRLYHFSTLRFLSLSFPVLSLTVAYLFISICLPRIFSLSSYLSFSFSVFPCFCLLLAPTLLTVSICIPIPVSIPPSVSRRSFRSSSTRARIPVPIRYFARESSAAPLQFAGNTCSFSRTD